MPAMANITVKKNDGTTDIVFDALSASGGDGSPAVWRQDTGAVSALPIGLRSLFKLLTQWNGPKTARQMKYQLHFPYAVQDSTTTLYSSKDKVLFDGIVTIPQGIPSTHIDEAISQGLNLLAATLVKSSGKAGFAPT